MASEEERTEQATPKKRQEARSRGEITRSPDVVSAFGALGVVAFAGLALHSVGVFAVDAFRGGFSGSFAIRSEDYEFAAVLERAFQGTLWKLTPFLIVVALALIAAELTQTRFLFLPNKLRPDFNRLNPLRGLSRMLTWGSLTQSLWTLAKCAILLVIALTAIRVESDSAIALAQGEAGEVVAFIERLLLRVSYRICFALVVFAALDYAARRWKYERDLRMTQQELRDEMKEEGGAAKRGGRRRGSLDTTTAVETTAPTRPASSQRQARDPREKKDAANRRTR